MSEITETESTVQILAIGSFLAANLQPKSSLAAGGKQRENICVCLKTLAVIDDFRFHLEYLFCCIPNLYRTIKLSCDNRHVDFQRYVIMQS